MSQSTVKIAPPELPGKSALLRVPAARPLALPLANRTRDAWDEDEEQTSSEAQVPADGDALAAVAGGGDSPLLMAQAGADTLPSASSAATAGSASSGAAVATGAALPGAALAAGAVVVGGVAVAGGGGGVAVAGGGRAADVFAVNFSDETGQVSFVGDGGEPIALSVDSDGSLVFTCKGVAIDLDLPLADVAAVVLATGQTLQVSADAYSLLNGLQLSGTGTLELSDVRFWQAQSQAGDMPFIQASDTVAIQVHIKDSLSVLASNSVALGKLGAPYSLSDDPGGFLLVSSSDDWDKALSIFIGASNSAEFGRFVIAAELGAEGLWVIQVPEADAPDSPQVVIFNSAAVNSDLAATPYIISVPSSDSLATFLTLYVGTEEVPADDNWKLLVDGASGIYAKGLVLADFGTNGLIDQFTEKGLGDLLYYGIEDSLSNLFVGDTLKTGVATILEGASSIVIPYGTILTPEQQAILESFKSSNPSLSLSYDVALAVTDAEDQALAGARIDASGARAEQTALVSLSSTSGDATLADSQAIAGGASSRAHVNLSAQSDNGNAVIGTVVAEAYGRVSDARVSVVSKVNSGDGTAHVMGGTLISAGVGSYVSGEFASTGVQDLGTSQASVGLVDLYVSGSDATGYAGITADARGDVTVQGLNVYVGDTGSADALITATSRGPDGRALVDQIFIDVAASTSVDVENEFHLALNLYSAADEVWVNAVDVHVGSGSRVTTDLLLGSTGKENPSSVGIKYLHVDVENDAVLQLNLTENGYGSDFLLSSGVFEGEGHIRLLMRSEEMADKITEMTDFDFSKIDVTDFSGDLSFSALSVNNHIKAFVGTAYGEKINMSLITLGVTIDGGGGDDVITGGSGDDVMAGGLGADTLTGGAGANTFKFVTLDSPYWDDDRNVMESFDVITDFKAGDKIDFSGLFVRPDDGYTDEAVAWGTLFDFTAEDFYPFADYEGSTLTGPAVDKFDAWLTKDEGGKYYLVYETTADGQWTEVIQIDRADSETLGNFSTWKFANGVVTVV